MYVILTAYLLLDGWYLGVCINIGSTYISILLSSNVAIGVSTHGMLL
jgi:hypothetical protein